MTDARLVLVRHGESVSNTMRRLDTRPPGAPLTPRGREQAREFAASHPRRVAVLVSSVALRAVQTAAEIGAVLGVPPQQRDGLHEVQVGDWEMRHDTETLDAFGAAYARWHAGHLDEAMPGGESARDVLHRWRPVLEDLRARHLPDRSDPDDEVTGDVVVVGHGAAIRLVGAVLGGVDGGYAIAHHLRNARAVELRPVVGGGWEATRWAGQAAPFTTAAEPAGDDPMG